MKQTGCAPRVRVAASLAVVLLAVIPPPLRAGEITVRGLVTVPGYRRVRTAYTVTVFDDGTTRTTVTSAHAIVTEGGPRDGERTAIPEQTSSCASPTGEPGGWSTDHPECVIELVPPESNWETVTVRHGSPFTLAALIESDEVTSPPLEYEPPEELLAQIDPLVSEAEDAVEEAAAAAGAPDAEAASAVDASTLESNATLVGDPVSVATGALELEERELVVTAGAVEFALARTHRTGSGFGGSLGPGWWFSLDTRIVLGESRAAGDAVHTAHTALADLTDPDDGAEATLRDATNAATARRQSRRATADRGARDARGFEAAVREVRYSGPLGSEVRDELERQANAAAGKASDLEQYSLRLAAEIRRIRDVVGPAAHTELQSRVDELREEVARLEALAARSAAHAERNRRFDCSRTAASAADGTQTAPDAAGDTGWGSSAGVGINSVVVVGPDGVARRYAYDEPPDPQPTTTYGDGSLNCYPTGATLSPAEPSTDTLRLLSNGQFIVERRDGTTWRYGFYGELREIRDRNGNGFRFAYDADERMTSITDTRGREITLHRDHHGRVERIEAPEEVTVDFEYDEFGRLGAVADEVGDVTEYDYEGGAGRPRVSRVVRTDGSSREYAYRMVRGRWRTVSAADEEGATERFDFSVPGITRHTGLSGLVRVYHQDHRRRTVRVDLPGGLHESYDFDDRDLLRRHRAPDGSTIEYEYDDRNNLTAVRYPDATTEVWSYDSMGLLRMHTDRLGLTTSYRHDQRGNLVRVDHGDGTADEYTRVPGGGPASGEIATHTDRRGNTTRFRYDEHGFLAHVADDVGPAGSYVRTAYGMPIVVVDAEGARFEIERRADGRIREVIGPNEYEAAYIYNERKDLVRVVECGRETLFSYDRRHLLIRKENAAGEVTRYEYSDGGRLTAREQLGPPEQGGSGPDGRRVIRTEYEYDNRGLPESARIVQIDAVTRYEYDDIGRVSAVTDAAGARTEYSYSFDGRLRTRRRFLDGRALVERYNYAPDGFLRSYTDPLGHTWRRVRDPAARSVAAHAPEGGAGAAWSYGPYGFPLTVSEPDGRIRDHRYDARGRLVELRNGDYREAAYRYDGANRLVARTDGEGFETGYAYDALGRLIAVTHPDGSVRSYAHNRDGTLAGIIDETGLATRFEYDAVGRLIARIDPGGTAEGRTAFTWHHTGQLASTTDATGRTSRTLFDDGGRVIAHIDPAGSASRYVLDPMGRVVRTVDATGRAAGFEYDDLGRLVSTSSAGYTDTRYAYDDVGRVTSIADALGNRHGYEYDPAGMLVAETNSAGARKSYRYDRVRLALVTDYTGATAAYDYDTAGRVSDVAYSDGSFLRYRYDRNGRLVVAANESERLELDYDARGNLVAARGNFTGTDLEYCYDDAGRRVTRRDNASGTTTDYRYDVRGRLVAVDDSAAGLTKLAYDGAGRRVLTVAPTGITTRVSYDQAGRVRATVVTDAAETVIDGAAHLYDAAGRRVFDIDESARIRRYSYDDHGRLIEVQYPFAGNKRWNDYLRFARYGHVPPVPVGATIGADYTPGQSVAGRDGTPFQSYLDITPGDADALRDAYRTIHPLRKSALPMYQQVWTESFEYDAGGNRTAWSTGWGTVRYTFDEKGRLAGAGETSYHHNVAGNLTRSHSRSDSSTYSYTCRHRVRSAITDAAKARYAYDALGRRIVRDEEITERQPARSLRKDCPDGSPVDRTVYRYDGLSRVVSSRTRVELPGRADVSELAKPQTTGELRYRIPSSRAVSAVAGGIRKAIYSEVSVGRQTLAVSGPHGPRHLSRDLLGSVTVVTGSGIGTAELYEYDAFGSSLGAAPDVVQPYGYNGKPFDSLTCTYDYGFRDYSPALGRFSTPDPAQYGSNWYVYVNADPINFVDPWGLMPASDDEAAWVVGIGFGLRPVEFGYGQDRYRLADKDRLQRDIRTSTMYQPAAGGNYNLPAASKTWCNQACFDYMAATAPGLFTAATGGGRDRRHLTDPIDPSYNVNANEAAANLAAAAALNSTIRRAPQSQWLFESLGLPTTVREVNGQQAQTLGNEGYTVVAVRPASPSGHMAVVARDGSRYDHSLGPRVSHVGRRKGETTDALDAFGDTVSGVRYFYDQSQRRSFIDFSQGANTYVP